MRRQTVTTIGIERVASEYKVKVKGSRWNGSGQVPAIYLFDIDKNTANMLVARAEMLGIVTSDSPTVTEWDEMRANVRIIEVQ